MVQWVTALYDRPLTGKGTVARCTVAPLQAKLASIKSIDAEKNYVYKYTKQKKM